MKVEILSGAAASSRLDDERFLVSWANLAAHDGKLTLLQEPEFVRAWFRAYGDVEEPLLVLGSEEDGTLCGLLPLTRSRQDGTLRHAGAGQAEYHGWIASEERDGEFAAGALVALLESGAWRQGEWRWRWCPPGAPLAWTESKALLEAGIRVTQETRPSPVWDLTDADKLERVQASRSLRAKRNRYKRSGGFRLERIRDVERTAELLATLAVQCDFRQEAVNGVRPFGDDPRKAAFVLERQATPDANHFSVLWNGDEPVAFHFGAADGRTCQLGLSAHAPSHARNSPGTLLMVELARSLTEDGYERFDLTPGTDAYKQRFANAEQDLTRVTLHTSRRGAWRSALGARARSTVVRASSRQDLRTQDRLGRWQRRLSRITGSGDEPGTLRERIAGRRRWLVLARNAGAAVPQDDTELPAPLVERQRYEQLLQLGDTPGFRTRRELLADALERFSEGKTLYGVLPAGSSAGVPLLIGWGGPRPRGAVAEGLERAGVEPESVVFLDGFVRTQPEQDHRSGHDASGSPSPSQRASEPYRACLTSMLEDLGDAGARVLLCVDPEDPDARRAALDLGFEERGRATEKRVLGRSSWIFQLQPTGAAR